MMLAPTFPALTGFGPLLPGSGGISRESSGRSCDSEEEEGGSGLDLWIKAVLYYLYIPIKCYKAIEILVTKAACDIGIGL